MLLARRKVPAILLLGLPIAIILLLLLWHTDAHLPNLPSSSSSRNTPTPIDYKTPSTESYFWKTLKVHNPAPLPLRPLPTSSPAVRFPQLQASSYPHTTPRRVREERRRAVKHTFERAWSAYRARAWLADELRPVSGGARNAFGGWAATLVDALDTLWIMDMRPEFAEAVAAAELIDFTAVADLDQVNVFETTIRYLGGFLAAFDLSADPRLLRKAVEVGDMLYKAFDTPNRMPITRWDFAAAKAGEPQSTPSSALVAEVGSLCMEFTRLSVLTGDAKWYDATQRVMEVFAAQQNRTRVPGLFPLVVDPEREVFYEGDTFTLGAMADSVYEYLPKMSALLGGREAMYRSMWENAAGPAVEHNLFRPMTPSNADILVAGQAHARDAAGEGGGVVVELEPQGQHLVCFLGGLFALGGKLFGRAADLDVARRLVDGCVYAYKAFPHGVMPETFYMVPCASKSGCAWDEELWKRDVLSRSDKEGENDADRIIKDDRLVAGFSAVPDRRYILRPEAIESVFVLYRTTGDPALLEDAWAMFAAIEAATRTELANTAVWDVTTAEGERPPASDSMESFWVGETLKYFYLIFSEPGLVSLDEFVFNTEAHPFRRWK